jgi:hypothetical protein
MPEDTVPLEMPAPLPPLQDTDSTHLLEKIIDVLESIDKSIDFLAAAMTGMDPLEIQMGQTALGRLALPTARDIPEPIERETKIDENITISNALLEALIEEEIIEALKERVK